MDRIEVRHKELFEKAFLLYGYGAFEETFSYFYCYCNNAIRECSVETRGDDLLVLVKNLEDQSKRYYIYSNDGDSWVPSDLIGGTRVFHRYGKQVLRQDAVVDVGKVLLQEGKGFSSLRRKVNQFRKRYACRYEVRNLEDTSLLERENFLDEWVKWQGKQYSKADCTKELSLFSKHTYDAGLNLTGSILYVDGKIVGMEVSAVQGRRSSSLLMKALPLYEGSAYFLRLEQLKKLQELGVQFDNTESPFQTKGVEQFKMTFRPQLLDIRGEVYDKQREN